LFFLYDGALRIGPSRESWEYTVSYSKVSVPLLVGAMLVAALPAHAQQPASSAPASSAAPAAAPPQTSAPAQTAAPAAAQSAATDAAPTQPSAETLKKAKNLGLRPEVKNGVTRYCWEDANPGSRFTSKKCADESQLDEIIAMREAQKDNLRRTMTGTNAK
jgi:hypothetical protein